MLTTAEAASRLGVKQRWLWRLIASGKIAATWNEYARRYEIDEAEVERYAREKRPAHRPKRGEHTDE